jgi:F420-non-reducing hydrogenase small subunit
MQDKPKIAFYWCASCGGCEEAVVDLGETLLDVAEQADIVLWPVALDYKRKDVDALPDGSILVSFINGAVRTSEQREWAEMLRRKSRLVVAFGSCAQMGGIVGLGNLFRRSELIAAAYDEAATVENPSRPAVVCAIDGHGLTLPQFSSTVWRLEDVIEVDYYVPGCPPARKVVADAILAVLRGGLPAKGTVLAPDFALCEECPRKESKPEKLLLREFKQIHQAAVDESTCLLAQGFLCMGPATRAGCEAACIQGNMLRADQSRFRPRRQGPCLHRFADRQHGREGDRTHSRQHP